MAYSNNVISFALPDTEIRIDAIPLFEVVEVVSMQDGGAKNEDLNISGRIQRDNSKLMEDDPLKIPTLEKKSGDSNKVMFHNALQIYTSPDGYNSGRQYVIKARDEAEHEKIVQELRRLSKIARDKFLAKTKFDMAQASPPTPHLNSCTGLYLPS